MAGRIGLNPADAGDNGRDWLNDSAKWRKVEAGTYLEPGCVLSEALPNEIGFPRLAWSSVTPGREAADVIQGYSLYEGVGEPWGIRMVSGKDGWRPVLAFGFGVKVDAYALLGFRLVRLDSGSTIAVVKAAGGVGCSIAGGPRHVAIPGGDDRYLVGLATSDPAPWTWAAPALPVRVPYSRAMFDIELPTADGVLFWLGFGAVYKQRDAAASAYDVLEEPSGALRGSGQGDLALWTDYAVERQRIRGWSPDGSGVRTIVEEAPLETCSIVLSPTAMVGLGTRGRLETSGRCTYPADQARVWRSPRAYGPSAVTIDVGPSLPGAPAQVSLESTWGDWAAIMVRPVDYVGEASFQGRDALDHYLLVRLSTWEVYRIDPASGHRFGGALGLSDDYLYYAETASNQGTIQRVVRLNLSTIKDTVPEL